MKTRILSACIMLPLLILVYLGGLWLFAAALAVGVIGLREFYKGFEAVGTRPCLPLGYIAVAALYALNAFFPEDYRFVMFWAAAVVMCSMIYGLTLKKGSSRI